MTLDEMIEFATDQLDVFASDSDMGKFLQNVIDELDKQKWISVEDRLPEDDANVLAFIKYVMVDGTCVGEENTMCDVTWYNPSSKRWFLPGLKEAEVKAWMPIPEYHFPDVTKKVGGAE